MKTNVRDWAWTVSAALIISISTVGWSGARGDEQVEFDSPLYPGEGNRVVPAFLRGETSSDVKISGRLSYPDAVAGPVPAVIVAHTSAGPGSDVATVASAMRKAGFASLTYHSFAPRNFGSSGNASQSGGGPRLEIHQAADAYMALKALAATPRIDARRVAVVGLSAGGNSALLAASERVRKRYVGENGPRFAALVAIYPGGYFVPTGKDVSTRTPILILPAEKDDLMSWSRTKAWVDYVLRENPPVSLTYKLVPGATHSFLNDRAQSNPNVPGSGTCPFTLANFGESSRVFLQVDGTITQSFPQGCQSRGATMAYSSQAASFALDETVAFLKKSFAAAE
ncbi:MAG: dienelactone hydrolase family protein [Proteobacteria bacterium]|nr:dienelactone hydrolase family protein [Pseudomonadota bacterium]